MQVQKSMGIPFVKLFKAVLQGNYVEFLIYEMNEFIIKVELDGTGK